MEKRVRELVANKLRSIRADLDYTIDYVANNTNISKDTISRYENNQNSMQIDLLEKMLEFYGYDFNIFFKEIYANKQNLKEQEE